MQYLLLIYADESDDPSQDSPEGQALLQRYLDFNDQNREVIVGGNALMPVATATTVRVRDGAALTTDGPFAETKEQLGGYYLVECEDLDQALDVAAAIPSADYGSIEVRPVLTFDIPDG